MESTVVDISMTPPSFKPDSLFLSRSHLSKTPKQVFFDVVNIFDIFYHTLFTVFVIILFSFNVNNSFLQQSFFTKKTHIIDDGTIRVRGLAAIDAPSPNIGVDKGKAMTENLPVVRQKALTFDHFATMHKALEEKQDNIRRHTLSAEEGLKATRIALDATERFNALMGKHRQRKAAENLWSVRWFFCFTCTSFMFNPTTTCTTS